MRVKVRRHKAQKWAEQARSVPAGPSSHVHRGLGFLGYVVFFLSWAGIIIALLYKLVYVLIGNTYFMYDMTGYIQYGAQFGGVLAAVGLTMMAVSILVLLYFGLVDWSAWFIKRLAKRLKWSVARVKYAGVGIGCVLLWCSIALLRLGSLTVWLYISAIALVAGLLSFLLEHAAARSTT